MFTQCIIFVTAGLEISLHLEKEELINLSDDSGGGEHVQIYDRADTGPCRGGATHPREELD